VPELTLLGCRVAFLRCEMTISPGALAARPYGRWRYGRMGSLDLLASERVTGEDQVVNQSAKVFP
jgi:hypothetical protein